MFWIPELTSRLTFTPRKAAAPTPQGTRALMARMTHDMRTPLNSIVGMVRLLSARPLDTDTQDMLKTLQLATDNLLALVNDMLDLDRLESGRMPFERRTFCLRNTMARVLDPLAPLAAQKGLMLRDNREVFLDRPPLLGDDRRIGQVLMNLVSNAITHTAQGEVEVRAELQTVHDRVTLQVDVTDTGVGIAPERQALIFQPFEQAHASTARTHGGTGLGLAICRELITQMGGELGVESVPGEGARFWFRLPLEVSALPLDAEDGQVAAQRRPGCFSRVDAATAHVLVAEDDVLSQDYMRRLLAGFGVQQVDIVSDGTAAWARLQTQAYTLALLDCHLPGVDGYQLARQRRLAEQDDACQVLPMIAVTANALEGEERICRAAGMDDYVAKPIDPAHLHAVLSQWVLLLPNPFQPLRLQMEKAVDLSQMRSFCEGDAVAERRLILLFMNQAQVQLDEMRTLARVETHKAWTEQAHKLKGSAGCVGAETLRRLAEQAQHAATLAPSGYDDLMSRLDTALAQVNRELAEVMAGLPER